LKFPIFLAILLTALLFLPAGAPAADAPVRLNAYSEGGVLPKKVKSLRELRRRQMVSQSRDFSCGAAALATVMHYYYGQEISEMDAILGMFKYGDQEDIQKRGFSLLDMKRYAETLKYKASGLRVPKLSILKDVKIPVITLIETNTYKHFVVIRDVDDRFVYISDPSWGNRRISLEDFTQIWPQQIIFAVQGPKVGTPEGLFVETDATAIKASAYLRREVLVGNRFVMDPTNAIIFSSSFPLINLPGIISGGP